MGVSGLGWKLASFILAVPPLSVLPSVVETDSLRHLRQVTVPGNGAMSSRPAESTAQRLGARQYTAHHSGCGCGCKVIDFSVIA